MKACFFIEIFDTSNISLMIFFLAIFCAVVAGKTQTLRKSDSDLPEVKLPKVSFDKSKVPQVIKLDEMLKVSMVHEKITNLVYERIVRLENESDESLSGDAQEIIKIIHRKVNAYSLFEKQGKGIINDALRLSSEYSDDREFGSLYRDTYIKAEEAVGTIPGQGPEVRKYMTEFKAGYPAMSILRIRNLKEYLDQASEIKIKIINQVLSSANTDLMVLDYKKGKDLSDLVNNSRGKIDAVKVLDPNNESLKKKLKEIEDKRKSRAAEIMKGLEQTTFPPKYTGGSAPPNATTLENSIKAFLGKSASGDYKTIKMVNIASGWTMVYHPIYIDKAIYKQIDFYVGVQYPNEQAGIIDILYVTGKTGSPTSEIFATYSVGSVGQMLLKNLK